MFINIPSHLKRVAETLMFTNWSERTLINISFSLSVISLRIGLLYLQAAEAVWLYMLQHYIIIFDRFCWSLSFPQAVSALTFCASFAAPSPKVQWCKRLVWTSRFLSTDQPSTFISKQRVYQKKCMMWMIWGRIWLMRELERNTALSMTALISGADVSMSAFEPQEDIHCDINWPKLY